LPSAGLECISKAIFASIISFSIQWRKRWKRKMPYAASTSLLSASIDICNSYAAAQYYMVTWRSFLLNYPFAKVTTEAFASKVPELNSYYYPRMTSSWAGSYCAGGSPYIKNKCPRNLQRLMLFEKLGVVLSWRRNKVVFDHSV
jgi:hypothetical protein